MSERVLKIVVDGSKAMWRVIWPILKEVSLEEAKELAKDLGKEIGEKVADHIGDTVDKARDALMHLLNDMLKPTDDVINAPSASEISVDTRIVPVAPSPPTPPAPEVPVHVAPAQTSPSVASAPSEILVPDVDPATTTTPPHLCIRAPALPRFKFAPRIGAPATPNQAQSTPAALNEATATESSSSHVMWYLLGGAAVLVVVGGVIYNQKRHRAAERGRGNVEPRATDDETPTTDGTDNDSGPSEKFPDNDESSKSDDANAAASSEDQKLMETVVPSSDDTLMAKTDADNTHQDIDGTTCKEESSKTEGVQAVSSEDQDDRKEDDAPKANANDEDTKEATRPGQTVVKPEDEAPKPAAGM